MLRLAVLVASIIGFVSAGSEIQLQGPKKAGVLIIKAVPNSSGNVFTRNGVAGAGGDFTKQQFSDWLAGWLSINAYAVNCDYPFFVSMRLSDSLAKKCDGIDGTVSVLSSQFNERNAGSSVDLVVPFTVTASQTDNGKDQRDLCLSNNDVARLRFAASKFDFTDIKFSCDVSLLDTKRGTLEPCTCGTTSSVSWGDIWTDAPVFVQFQTIAVGVAGTFLLVVLPLLVYVCCCHKGGCWNRNRVAPMPQGKPIYASADGVELSNGKGLRQRHADLVL